MKTLQEELDDYQKDYPWVALAKATLSVNVKGYVDSLAVEPGGFYIARNGFGGFSVFRQGIRQAAGPGFSDVMSYVRDTQASDERLLKS